MTTDGTRDTYDGRCPICHSALYACITKNLLSFCMTCGIYVRVRDRQ